MSLLKHNKKIIVIIFCIVFLLLMFYQKIFSQETLVRKSVAWSIDNGQKS